MQTTWPNRILMIAIGIAIGCGLMYGLLASQPVVLPGPVKPVVMPNAAPSFPLAGAKATPVSAVKQAPQVIEIRDSIAVLDTLAQHDTVTVQTKPDTATHSMMDALIQRLRAAAGPNGDSIAGPDAPMPAFLLDTHAPTWTVGFTLAHDFLNGGYTGGALTRVLLGEFTIYAEVGFWRTNFETLVGVQILPWTIVK